jgi:putative lipoprotein
MHDDRPTLRVTGTVTYRARIALPPGAELTVRVLDVARADAPAVVVAETVIEVVHQVPIPFELELDPARLDDRGRFTVAAQIHVGGRLRWTTDTAVPVSPTESTTDLELVLVMVGAAPPSAAAPDD